MTKDLLVACPNCYRAQTWDGSLSDVQCRRCSGVIPVTTMASALVHLFSAAAFDGHDNIENEEADSLLQWLAHWLWGDALRVGRHDWVYAGCPTSVEAVLDGIQNKEGAGFDSLRRLITIKKKPELLVNASTEISAAAISRLNALLTSTQESSYSVIREGLYYLLSSYPSPGGVTVLEECARMWADMDGDSTRPVGAALADALEACRKSHDIQPENG